MEGFEAEVVADFRLTALYGICLRGQARWGWEIQDIDRFGRSRRRRGEYGGTANEEENDG